MKAHVPHESSEIPMRSGRNRAARGDSQESRLTASENHMAAGKKGVLRAWGFCEDRSMRDDKPSRSLGQDGETALPCPPNAQMQGPGQQRQDCKIGTPALDDTSNAAGGRPTRFEEA